MHDDGLVQSGQQGYLQEQEEECWPFDRWQQRHPFPSPYTSSPSYYYDSSCTRTTTTTTTTTPSSPSRWQHNNNNNLLYSNCNSSYCNIVQPSAVVSPIINDANQQTKNRNNNNNTSNRNEADSVILYPHPKNKNHHHHHHHHCTTTACFCRTILQSSILLAFCPATPVFQSSLPNDLLPLCPIIIDRCESYAQESGGWQTNLFSLTKQDIALYNVFATTSEPFPQDGETTVTTTATIPDILRQFVMGTLEQLYQRRITMDRNQPHILKYDATHRSVPLHYDQCALTVNLALNDSYTGGGTFISALQRQLVCRTGEFLIHPGHMLHSGCEITSGARYLLLFFCNFVEEPTKVV